MRRSLLKRNKMKFAKLKEEAGATLIEVVLIIVILGIAVAPLSRLAIINVNSGADYAMMTRSLSFAQETIEEVIADYAASGSGRGYEWVLTNWGSHTDYPTTGYTRSVRISGESTMNGVTYSTVRVTVSNGQTQDVVLETIIVR